MRTYLPLLVVLFFVSGFSNAQKIEFDGGVKKELHRHISILASDQMMGREAGGAGETPASGYLNMMFRSMEISPAVKGEYFQPFEFNDGASIGRFNNFIAENKKYKINSDFYPLGYSGTAQGMGKLLKVGFGISAPDLGYDDYKDLTHLDMVNRIFVIELSSPDGIHPHSKYIDHSDIVTKIELAIEKKAEGIIFINSDTMLDDPKQKLGRDIIPYEIPIIFATGEAYNYIDNYNGIDVVNFYADIDREKKTGNNVIGKIDNGAALWVIIGAHYDHLGFGIEGSLHRDEKKEVHNGADDNASGVALMIELARQIKLSGVKSYNYLFIGFTGEEKGLLGSNYYVKNPVVDALKVSYMINMDMVGRLNADKPVLQINGVGTAKEWPTIMNAVDHSGFEIITTESGVGPSDHTSFYLENIPVLHFFSGTHEDYHKPSDDLDKINFNGIVDIGNYILELISRSNPEKKFEFVKTKDENIFKAPKFTVTLGVVPDYAYAEEGMRIDGVTEGRPADKSGMIKGDIVLKLGSFSVRDMTSYMEALSKFKAGEKTTVTFLRGDERITNDIQF